MNNHPRTDKAKNNIIQDKRVKIDSTKFIASVLCTITLGIRQQRLDDNQVTMNITHSLGEERT